MAFIPKKVFFEPESLKYPLGEKLLRFFEKKDVQVALTASHNRLPGYPRSSHRESYLEGKKTLVVGVRRTLSFASCRPSANYQLPLATSCPGQCEYCYLMTNLGKTPYIRVYVNLEEILSAAGEYINKRIPQTTLFEGSATSDPVPVEPYTGSLKKVIEFVGKESYAGFRFVTKFPDIDSLLDADHRGKTRFRVSINPDTLIRKFEHATPVLSVRLATAKKAAEAGYPVGFLVAPIIAVDEWKKHYRELFSEASSALKDHKEGLTFEFISHRFTKRAKATIMDVFPETELELNEQSRVFKFGQFGYGKYIYTEELFQEIKIFLTSLTEKHFPGARIEYFV